MKMSRGINLHFRSEKYSNAAESYATEMSAENRAYPIRNILTKAAEFRCQNCQFERTLCPAGKNFSSGKILSRRPRIIRGLSSCQEGISGTTQSIFPFPPKFNSSNKSSSPQFQFPQNHRNLDLVKTRQNSSGLVLNSLNLTKNLWGGGKNKIN